ncbi:MAG: ABC transporter ATP-binding protein [Firmicutes bacterium]|nr:ABC transporter ATP-binding protein [Bacillota bacterium]
MLAIEGLTVRYSSSTALNSVSLAIPPVSLFGLTGPNGAGKTTLFRTISGLVRAAVGSIKWEGRPLQALTPGEIVRLGVSQVPEGRHVFKSLSVADNLLLGCWDSQHKVNCRRNLERIWEVFPELQRLRTRKAGSLSGGEQQMLAIGRALMTDPKLLMIDELSLGLAPIVTDCILEYLRQLPRQGVTVLLVEQNLRLVLETCNEAAVLESGTVRAHGPTEVLRQTVGVETYLGLSPHEELS